MSAWFLYLCFSSKYYILKLLILMDVCFICQRKFVLFVSKQDANEIDYMPS